MPEWLHARATHIMARNPAMPKSEAFALATQQSHALGKSPKGYGTAEGRATAKAKFKTPKDDKKTANPGQLKAAGMTVEYDTSFNPTSAHTHNEWLASLFKRDGSFKLPASLEHVEPMKKRAAWAAFVDELEKQALSPATEARAALAGIARRAERAGADLSVYPAHKQLQTFAGRALAGEPVPSGVIPKLHARLSGALHGQGLSKAAGQFEFSTNPYSGPMNPAILSQASDLPPFRQPQLQRGIQKNSGDTSLPTGNPEPLRSDKYASVTTEQLSELVADLRKQAMPGLTPAGRLEHTQRVGAPRATAPPGPSIADIAKPRGARFGSGIPGAFKTGIGGNAGVSLR